MPDNPPSPAVRSGYPGRLHVAATLVLAALALLVPTDYPPRRLTYPIMRPEAAEIARAFLRDQGVDPAPFRAVTWSSAGFPRFHPESGRPESNLPPWRDDGLARRYAAEVGGLAAWEAAATRLLPSACWTTRLIRRDRGDEWFVTVNPRTRAVVAFWRERRGDGASGAEPGAAGAADDPTAGAVAAGLIARLAPPGAWQQQSMRRGRDGAANEQTLLFEDPSQAIGAARLVATIVIRDGAPAGFATGLLLPAGWVQEQTQATLLSGLVTALRFALVIGLGGLGLVAMARRLTGRGAEVRAAARVALLLLIPILLYHLNRSPTLLVRYPASVPWSVFVASSAVGLALSVLSQALLIALCLLALAAVRRDWRTALPPDGWRPVARPALAVALSGLAVGVVVDRLELLGRLRWPGLFPGPTPPTLPGYGAIFPFFDVGWTAATGSFFVGGLIAIVTLLSQGPFRGRRARAVVLVLVAVGLAPDRARTVGEAIVPTLFEILALLTAIFLARRLARGLLPAYAAFLPLALGGQSALVLIGQPDLQARLSGGAALAILATPLALLTAQALRAPAPPRDAGRPGAVSGGPGEVPTL